MSIILVYSEVFERREKLVKRLLNRVPEYLILPLKKYYYKNDLFSVAGAVANKTEYKYVVAFSFN